MAAGTFSTPLAQLRIAELDPQDRIAKYFLLYELTVSETADRQRIANRIPDDRCCAARAPGAPVLDPMRETWRASAQRIPLLQALERSPGRAKPRAGSDQPAHPRPRLRRRDRRRRRWSWRAGRHHAARLHQIICECYADPRKGPNSGWVVRPACPGAGRNRRQGAE